MAQTKRKRRTKHRGTPAGTVEARGRTGRRPTSDERARARTARPNRFEQPPTWKGAIQRAALAAGIFFVVVVALFRQPLAGAISIGFFMFLVYIPLGFYTDQFLYNRRMRRKASGEKATR